MEHTKGEWKYIGLDVRGIGQIMVGRRAIAQVWDWPEAEANARLIAASPALLESCQYVEMASEGIELDGTESDDHALQITITAAGLRDLRAAIAKARRTA
jgi:hypothetical protein